MLDEGISSLLVVGENNGLEGILTTTDFLTIVAKSQPKAETSVSRYMTTDVVTTTAQEPIRNVAGTMLDHGFHHMPVVDATEGVIGIVSTTDLAVYLSQVQPAPS
jgi:CBS domain-containing protein